MIHYLVRGLALATLLVSLFPVCWGGVNSYISWENQLSLDIGMGLSSGYEATDSGSSTTFLFTDRLNLTESFDLGWHFYSAEDSIVYNSSWRYVEDQVRVGGIGLDLRREKKDHQILMKTQWDPDVLSRLTSGQIRLTRPERWVLMYGDDIAYSDLAYPSLGFLGAKYENSENPHFRYQLIRGKISDAQYVYGGKTVYQDPIDPEKLSWGISFLTFEDADYIPLDQIFSFKGIYTFNRKWTLSTDFTRTLGGDKVDVSGYVEWLGRTYYSTFHKFSIKSSYFYHDAGFTLEDSDTKGYAVFLKYRTFEVFKYIINWIAGYEYSQNNTAGLPSVNTEKQAAYSLTSAWNILEFPRVHFGGKLQNRSNQDNMLNADDFTIFLGLTKGLTEATFWSSQWSLANVADTGSAATANREFNEIMAHSLSTEVFWGTLDFNHVNQNFILKNQHKMISSVGYHNFQNWGGVDFAFDLSFSAERDDQRTVDNTALGLDISLATRFEGFGKTSVGYQISSIRDGLDPSQSSYVGGLSYEAVFSWDFSVKKQQNSIFSHKLWLLKDETLGVDKAKAMISGQVFHDSNGNGQLDKGESPVRGVIVKLSGYAYERKATDAQGWYQFIIEVPFDTQFKLTIESKSLPIDLLETDGSTVTFIFSRAQAAHRINLPVLSTQRVSGLVFDDINRNGVLDPGESGLSNVQVLLDNGSQISYSDKKGKYLFSGVSIGKHTLQIVPTRIDRSWISTTGLDKQVEVFLDQATMDQRFGFYVKRKPKRKVRKKVF